MTPHFLLQSLCVEFSNSHKNNEGSVRPQHPGEACSSCEQVVSKIIPTFAEPPALLQELLTSSSAGGIYFRKNIRQYNSASSISYVRTEFISRVPRVSKYNPIITNHGRMYHKIGALQPADGVFPRYASVYIHDTEHSTLNRMHFLESCGKICCASWHISWCRTTVCQIVSFSARFNAEG